jgi:hypothetical protein
MAAARPTETQALNPVRLGMPVTELRMANASLGLRKVTPSQGGWSLVDLELGPTTPEHRPAWPILRHRYQEVDYASDIHMG